MTEIQPDVAGSTGGGGGSNNLCFMAGSRIAAAEGTVCVEDLTLGSLVLTVAGELRPVRWLGHRGVDCTRYRDPTVVWPICVKAGAFAHNQPERDLWLSPRHAILTDGVLIPAEKLVNGATIVQVPRERVEYWHVELDSHDVLLAEGLPVESYLDNGNRTAFVDGGAYLEAHPDFEPKHWADTCVPLIMDGPGVEHAKAALCARAHALGYQMTADPHVHLMADGRRIEPLRLSPMRVAFTLPVAVSDIELRCRSFVPAHTDPASTDTRLLGICVSRLQLDGVDLALEDAAAFVRGWYGPEGDPNGQQWRWTRDCVSLPAQARLIVVDYCNQSFYWTEPETESLALTG